MLELQFRYLAQMDLTLIQDGNSTVEHNIPLTPSTRIWCSCGARRRSITLRPLS